jgi:hypothetical protein
MSKPTYAMVGALQTLIGNQKTSPLAKWQRESRKPKGKERKLKNS